MEVERMDNWIWQVSGAVFSVVFCLFFSCLFFVAIETRSRVDDLEKAFFDGLAAVSCIIYGAVFFVMVKYNLLHLSLIEEVAIGIGAAILGYLAVVLLKAWSEGRMNEDESGNKNSTL